MSTLNKDLVNKEGVANATPSLKYNYVDVIYIEQLTLWLNLSFYLTHPVANFLF